MLNNKLLEKYAQDVPGEKTVLLKIGDLANDNNFTFYKAQSAHQPGIPVSSFRDNNGELYILQHNGYCHSLVAGSTGCGKSMRFLINQLFNLTGDTSVIIVDIKGELYRYTSAYLKQIYGKDNVKQMDFTHPDRSQIFFNPLTDIAKRYRNAELYPECKKVMRDAALADLRILFNKLFPICSENKSWESGAQGFIYGIALGLLEDMLLNQDQEARTGRRRVLPEQINLEAISEVFYNFSYSNTSGRFDDCNFFSSRPESDIVWRYVYGIINNAPTTRACYMQIIEDYLNGYNYPDIRNLTITDNLDISTLADIPQVIFLTYDITDEHMRGFVNQYIVKSLDTLKNKARDMETLRLNVPVLYLLDEFPTLEAHPIYSTIFSVGRGLNIFITAVVQDYTQLATTYSDGVAQQIRNNCNLNFFLGTNDLHTAQCVKEQIGKHVIPDPAGLLRGDDIKFTEQHVVSEDMLLHRMKPGEAYITINNHMPLKGHFELYFDCPEYIKFPLSSSRRSITIDFNDKKYHYDHSWMRKKY